LFVKEIVVFESGGGENFQAHCDAFRNSAVRIKAPIAARNCGAENVAAQNGAPSPKIDFKQSADQLVEDLRCLPRCDLVALCNFNRILPEDFLERNRTPVLNTHLSLLPDYGGRGMTGVKVV